MHLVPTKLQHCQASKHLPGADITGRFAGKGKMTCWKVMQELHEDDEIVQALTQLGGAENPSKASIVALEAFVCKFYLSHTELTNTATVRWWLFKKKQAQS